MTLNFVGAGFGMYRPDLVFDGGIPTPTMHRLDDGTGVDACPAKWGGVAAVNALKTLGAWQSK
jgi:hypothetical protein